MKILHITPRYYPYIDGTVLYCQELSERLARDGHRVTVFTTDAWDHEYFWDPAKEHLHAGDARHNGVEIHRFAVRHLLSNRRSFGVIRYIMRLLSSFPADTSALLFRLCPLVPRVPGLYQRLSENSPGTWHMIHATNINFDSMIYAAYQSARRTGAAFLITPFVHLGEPQDETVRQYYTMPHQLRLMLHSDGIIVQTDLEGDYLSSLGIPAEKMHKVGVGINPEGLIGGAGARFRDKYGLHAPIVFYIGALAYDKGTVHVIQAMMRLWQQRCQAQLVLAGPEMSAFRSYYESLPAWASERIHLLGFISEEDKRDLLDAGDIFVMPSRTDSFGIVYLEAWLYKKPVIGALAGGVPEVIDDNKDGYVVPFGDVDRLAEAIGTLLSDRTLAQQFGARGHQKAISHTWDRKYAAIKAIYQDLAFTGHNGPQQTKRD
jgi:glycosyltransferase involved in cell wall biosynthesis